MQLAHMGKRGTTDRRRFYRCAHGLSVPTISILPSFPHFTSPTKLRKANQIGPEGIWDLRARHTTGEVHGSRSALPCPLAGCSVHPWVHPKSILLFKFPPGWETRWRKRGAAGTDRRGFLQPGIPTGSGQQPLSSLPSPHPSSRAAHAGCNKGLQSLGGKQISSQSHRWAGFISPQHRTEPFPLLISAQPGGRQELPNDLRLRSEELALLLFVLSELVSPLIPLMEGGDC